MSLEDFDAAPAASRESCVVQVIYLDPIMSAEASSSKSKKADKAQATEDDIQEPKSKRHRKDKR